MDPERIAFQGLDGTTGDYLFPPLTLPEMATLAGGETLAPDQRSELIRRSKQKGNRIRGTRAGVDATRLQEAGWGVIMPYGIDPAIREALSPLLEWRRAQASAEKEHLYREFAGAEGFLPEDTKDGFLRRQKAGPGPVDPDRVPYYLLLVGDPDVIPFSFQHQLDVAYAVGRVHFGTVEEYAHYARSVVAAEKAGPRRARRVTFFGTKNPDDAATSSSANQLVEPLAGKRDWPAGWSAEPVLAEAATKTRLSRLLGGEETPALLVAACHGLGFPSGHHLQRACQGALVCQDWPGPDEWRGRPVPPDFYLSAEDIPSQADLLGLVCFCYTCYGAGTPRLDSFSHRLRSSGAPAEIAPASFVAALPQRLLGHPNGGALAVIGHVERAWSVSYLWQDTAQLTVFESMLADLMRGVPVGAAMEYLNQRYAEVATLLSDELEGVSLGKKPNPATLASLWTANNDARGYAVIGDPAVRLFPAGFA